MGASRIELERYTEHAWVTATPGATPVCAPENDEAAEEDLSPGRLQYRIGFFSLIYVPGAIPSYVLGCGSRLVPATFPRPAKPVWCQACAQKCPAMPWHLDVVTVARALDMIATRGRLPRRCFEVNEAV